MKRFLRFAALLSALALLGACDDDMYVTPLEVTNNNIAGTWQLAEWNGAPLAEGSFVYIEFIRKDAKYVMWPWIMPRFMSTIPTGTTKRPSKGT